MPAKIVMIDGEYRLADSILRPRVLHLAPTTRDIHKVLDVGTGTGQWAIEFVSCVLQLQFEDFG